MRVVTLVSRLRERSGLSTRVFVAVTLAVAAFVTAIVAFLGVTEDVTARNGLATSDGHHLHFFITHRTPGLVHLARVVTDAGALPVLLPLAVVATVLLLWSRTLVAFALAPVAALLGGGAATSLLKQAVGRPRPPLGLRLVTETEPSFPSGHATDSTAFYVALALVIAVVVLRRPLARLATVVVGTAVPTAVGLSRLVLGVHWPTDVMAGWALGGAVAVAVVLLAGLVARAATPSDRVRRRRLLARLALPLHSLTV